MKNKEQRVKNFTEYVEEHKNEAPQSPKSGRVAPPYPSPKERGLRMFSLALSPFGGVGGGFFFTPFSNNSRNSNSFLFRRREKVYNECIFAYIYNVKVKG